MIETERRRRAPPAPEGFSGCPKCQVVKPLSEFYFGRNGKMFSWCKACKAESRVRARSEFSWSYTLEDLARFLSKVDQEKHGPGCADWLGARDKDGYGLFFLNGRQLGAHRIAWFLAGRGIPPEWPWVIDHRCYNVACVNPAHLRVVLQEDNCGQHARGTPHWTNKHKTVCKHGHPFSGWMESNGRPTRVCLVCWPHQWKAVERFKAKHGDRPL